MCISYNWEIDVYRFSFYLHASNLTITGKWSDGMRDS